VFSCSFVSFGQESPQPVSSAPIVPFKLNLGVEAAQQPQDVDSAIKILFAMTRSRWRLRSFSHDDFTRIVIVLSFVRSALALQGTPANQILIGLSLFMTYFIMEPIWAKIDTQALQPYMEKKIGSEQALAEAAKPLRTFMLSQTRPKDVELFSSLSRQAVASAEETPDESGHPFFHHQRTAHRLSNGLFAVRSLHPDRPRRCHRPHEHGHDDDASGHRRAPAQAVAFRPG
jgi:flagellar biosynthesis protein FliP